jgi:diguanylate cyclase (GGDEF)-like protein
LDRSLSATIVRSGARLAAALVPLAAFAVISALPSAAQGSALPWVAQGIAATAALAAGLALLVSAVAALEKGRVRDLADLAGLGMLAVTFAAAAMEAAAGPGLAIGLVSASVAFAFGSMVGPRPLPGRRERVFSLVGAVVLVEACLAAILLIGSQVIDERTAGALLYSAAVLMAIAAVTSLDETTRATALGVAASAALSLGLAGASANGRLAGVAATALAAVVLGWRHLADRPRRALPASDAAGEPVPQLPAGEPEYDELSRLARELRATLDDLVAARHLIELQRVEIERASSTDQLTGLPSRWSTLERLRIEAAEARRYTHPVAVVLLDIDGFAELNHEHGLDVGDELLRRLALRLRVRMRQADAVGRIGADAFLAILPHTDEEGAATFARAVLDRVLERRIVTDRGEITVGLSVGIALMRPGMALTGDELLASAEEALASARAAGGNRIAFDRLHGLARLDGDLESESATGDVAERDR